ncbi:hypothetical protein M0812_09770 [Anaeramoeba flamelloides]|uniref:Monopolin complex subunit Csm1/Pcs1 C-terminal domain-containing protein n=1 Tax=Anaeramoeba flamelloides TaxID=1746091 RepID=A0AAV7ZPL5_9EUKA|nr:hypothetical protein M0812_09770 [Anaeramoeba flamelloides]
MDTLVTQNFEKENSQDNTFLNVRKRQPQKIQTIKQKKKRLLKDQNSIQNNSPLKETKNQIIKEGQTFLDQRSHVSSKKTIPTNQEKIKQKETFKTEREIETETETETETEIEKNTSGERLPDQKGIGNRLACIKRKEEINDHQQSNNQKEEQKKEKINQEERGIEKEQENFNEEPNSTDNENLGENENESNEDLNLKLDYQDLDLEMLGKYQKLRKKFEDYKSTKTKEEKQLEKYQKVVEKENQSVYQEILDLRATNQRLQKKLFDPNLNSIEKENKKYLELKKESQKQIKALQNKQKQEILRTKNESRAVEQQIRTIENQIHQMEQNKKDYMEQKQLFATQEKSLFESLEKYTELNSFLQLFSGMETETLGNGSFLCTCSSADKDDPKTIHFKLSYDFDDENENQLNLIFDPIKIDFKSQESRKKIPDYLCEPISFNISEAPKFLKTMLNFIHGNSDED